MSAGGAKLLPVHGFVLAGGKSSRMGQDKALLEFRGRPLVALAVECLRSFCEGVSISGNREDLSCFAPVVGEARAGAGPAAGIEAGLRAASHAWALFLPVDVPLAPWLLLRQWVADVLTRREQGVQLSFLRAGGERQPAFCLVHGACAVPWTRALEEGERKLGAIFERIAAELGPGSVWMADAETFAPDGPGPVLDVAASFSNLNTPEDLAALAMWTRHVPDRE